VSLVAFAATLFLWWRFNPADPGFQFVENRPWLPRPRDCVSCSACEVVCPTEAIRLQPITSGS